MRLSRRSEPFDSDLHIFELKIDGFRALAFLENGRGELVSRNGNMFRGFADLATWIAEHVRVESAVLDGEIACVDDAGRPVFRDLLFRRPRSRILYLSHVERDGELLFKQVVRMDLEGIVCKRKDSPYKVPDPPR